MRRRWSARVLMGTAIVLAVGMSGTALAMAAPPAGTTGSGTADGAPALPPGDDAYTRCIEANGAQVHTESSADGRRSVRVTLDPEHQRQALDACEQYAPAPGTIGGPAPIQPLTSAQTATVTKCLQAAGVTFPAPGTTQVLGLPPVDGPVHVGSGPGSIAGSGPGAIFGSGSISDSGAGPILVPGPGVSGGRVLGGGPGADGGPVLSGEPGHRGGLVVSSESGSGGEPAPGGPDAPGAPDGPGAPDPKVLGALGQCAQAAGLPGLALETRSEHENTTLVAIAGAPRP